MDAAINPDSDKVQQLIEDAQQGNVCMSTTTCAMILKWKCKQHVHVDVWLP